MPESFFWEKNLAGLSPEVARERRRVLLILESHKSHLGIAYQRLLNIVSNGLDLEEEMELPPEERAGGFNWPDAE